MKLGNLYLTKDEDILLYTGSYIEDYHKRSKMYVFKVIISKSKYTKDTRDATVHISSNYINYLRLLPPNHSAWILYGPKEGIKT